MRRVALLAMLLLASAALLQAQRPGGGAHFGGAPAAASRMAAAPGSASHASGNRGSRTEISAGYWRGRSGGNLPDGRPCRYGCGNGYGSGYGWLPWSSLYWDDQYYAEGPAYPGPENGPPPAQPVVVVENREPARPAPPPEPPKLVEFPLAKEASPAKPQPPTLFVLKDGEKLESHDYMLTASSLKIEVDRQQRVIPVSELDLNATLAANHERGIDLTFPRNNGTVFLGF
ncbi:MAG TPA: hypothetical protein VMT39_01055 [Candidatus Bathyarchaeia archaeon]|nr:hypothetical protein [Candidatus Bathyarchaeia archaeon]